MPTARTVIAAGLALTLTSACLRPPSPAEQVTEAARELNLATRFGRMDVASERTANAARKSFFERRRQWGTELRIVDVDLTAMSLADEENADVTVKVDWMRMSEGMLRSTIVSQHWKSETYGWQLTRERRLDGDVGLFGEQVVVLAPEAVQNSYFPSKTIR